jgi:hypothetical protein
MDAATAVKKSVTIDRLLLDDLDPSRTLNFSATVNEGLRLLASLDAQRALVRDWEASHGEFSAAEMEPFVDEVVGALTESMRLRLKSHR